MSARYVFVGERPSPKAARIGATWQNGRMAARTLHAALEEIGERPEAHLFVNLWRKPGLGPTRERLAPGVLAVVLEEMERGAVVVALGRLVERELQRRAIPHRPMVHPAARGKIRKRERYVEHVRTVLLGEQ
jgi:uracil-DNA glycosylase